MKRSKKIITTQKRTLIKPWKEWAIFILFVSIFAYSCQSGSSEKATAEDSLAVQVDTATADSLDVQTGLVKGEGLQMVKANCTPCHSSKLIVQNRFTRDGWHEKIVWMQHTQGLWDLGPNEDIILDYLAAHYAPEETGGRRQPLSNIRWYELKN